MGSKSEIFNIWSDIKDEFLGDDSFLFGIDNNLDKYRLYLKDDNIKLVNGTWAKYLDTKINPNSVDAAGIIEEDGEGLWPWADEDKAILHIIYEVESLESKEEYYLFISLVIKDNDNIHTYAMDLTKDSKSIPDFLNDVTYKNLTKSSSVPCGDFEVAARWSNNEGIIFSISKDK